MGCGALIPMPSTCPQLTNKIVFVVSFVGNRGTFIRGYKAMVMDMEFLYHVGYILTSVLGLFVHELFYSILVSPLGAGAGRGGGGRGFPQVASGSPVPVSLSGPLAAGLGGLDLQSPPLPGPSPAFRALTATPGPHLAHLPCLVVVLSLDSNQTTWVCIPAWPLQAL